MTLKGRTEGAIMINILQLPSELGGGAMEGFFIVESKLGQNGDN